jgi:predicted nucleic acid-binding Zn ribbon protein
MGYYDRNVTSLGDAIREFLKRNHLDRGHTEAALISKWEKVVGPMIAKHTTRMNIHKRTLYVHLDSAALRNELTYAREKICKALNREAGEKVIDEIVFR